MDVKEAARTAKEYLTDLFAEEPIMNVGLEEVEYEDRKNIWKITIGFSRVWNNQNNPITAVIRDLSNIPRYYKVVRIQDSSGKVISVKNRD